MKVAIHPTKNGRLKQVEKFKCQSSVISEKMDVQKKGQMEGGWTKCRER